MYDPEVGRFLEHHPISFRSLQQNFYQFVGGSVLNYVDPKGLKAGGPSIQPAPKKVSGRTWTEDHVFLIEWGFECELWCNSDGGVHFAGPLNEEFNTVWHTESFGYIIGGHQKSHEINIRARSTISYRF
jgi:hypothetical protein